MLPLPSPPISPDSPISVPQPHGTIIPTAENFTLSPTTGDRHFNLNQGAFLALNTTNPNATLSFWLCLAAAHPYYKETAISGTGTSVADPKQWSWGSQNNLTFTEFSGS